jgi:PAS domain S-box-containing protein
LVSVLLSLKKPALRTRLFNTGQTILHTSSDQSMAILAERDFLTRIFDDIRDGILVIDNDLTILFENPAVSQWYPNSEPIIGRKCYQTFKNLQSPCENCTNLPASPGRETAQEITPRRNFQGEIIGWLETYNFPLIDQESGETIGIIQHLRDITKRKATEEESHKLTARLKAIAMSARQMSSLLDVNLLSKQVVESLQKIAGCYSVNFFTIDEESLILKANSGGYDKDGSLVGLKIDLLDGIIAHVARSGQPLMVPDVSQDPHFLFWEGLPDTRSELAVPIKSGGRVLGVLDMQDTRAFAFSTADMDSMEIFADQLAVSMENAQLFTKIRQRTTELEVISLVSAALRVAISRKEMIPIILHQLMEILAADSAILFLVDPINGEMVIQRGLGTWEKYNGLSIAHADLDLSPFHLPKTQYLNNNLQYDPDLPPDSVIFGLKAMGGVPLLAQGISIGSVWIGRKSLFNDEEMNLLSAIADISANAIQRTSLHEQTQRRLQRISALQKIDLTIATSFDLQITFNVLLSEVVALLEVDAAAILVLNPYSQTLEFSSGVGFHSQMNKVRSTRLRLGQSLAGRIALERRSIAVYNLEEEQGLTPLLVEENFKSYFGVPLIVKGQLKGVLEVFTRVPMKADDEWLNFLNTLGGQAAIAIDNHSLFENLQNSNIQLTLAYDATIEGWSRALDLRDEETEGHTQRVMEMTLLLCEAFGINESDLVHIRRGALLHDIGKMGIPDRILLKPGPLTAQEWVVMKKHPGYAFEFLSPVSFLKPSMDIPYCHHERWDGTGYPRGIKGEQIPTSARIFAIADVWDALSSDRPYRSAWKDSEILSHLQSQSGSHFDPQIVELFFQLYRNDALRIKK